MILNAYAIFDSKAEAFNSPFFRPTRGQAIREFTEVCNDSASSINKYPEDFTLFHIGSYDDSTGLFTALPTPISLGLALEFVKS